jgi:hypothetical protein
LLSVEPNSVPYDFATGEVGLDREHIMVDKQGLVFNNDEGMVGLCRDCHKDLKVRHKVSAGALANYRWVGPVPDELSDLNWIEETLVSRAHPVGKIVRLQNRANNFLSVKGHMVLVPQDTTSLLDKLPLTPNALVGNIRVVWVGAADPYRAVLRKALSV